MGKASPCHIWTRDPVLQQGLKQGIPWGNEHFLLGVAQEGSHGQVIYLGYYAGCVLLNLGTACPKPKLS